MNNTQIENTEIETLLSRNEMIKWLYEFITSKPITELAIKITNIKGSSGIDYYCFRCNVLQEFITEMSRRVKAAVLSNIHDSLIVFLNHFLTHASSEAISKKDYDGIFKDLIVNMVRYEQKTAVDIKRTEFGCFVRKFLDDLLDSLESKEIWWFVSLYKLNKRKLPKAIKPPICSYYLVCMSLDTKATELKKMSEKRAKIAQEERIEKEINKNVDELLKQVENEDGFTEGIIFPVKNMIIVDELRREWQVAESRWKEEEQKRKEEENKRKEAEQKNAILIDFLKTQGFSEEKIKAELEKLNKK